MREERREGRAKAGLETTPRRASEHRPSNRQSNLPPRRRTSQWTEYTPPPGGQRAAKSGRHTRAWRIDPGRKHPFRANKCARLPNRTSVSARGEIRAAGSRLRFRKTSSEQIGWCPAHTDQTSLLAISAHMQTAGGEDVLARPGDEAALAASMDSCDPARWDRTARKNLRKPQSRAARRE